MKFFKFATTIIVTIVTTACSTSGTKPTESVIELPEWINNPQIENGLAATECVPANGDYNLINSKATALARLKISQQIETNVQGMEKTFGRLTDTSSGVSAGTNFETVSRQLSKQSLSGSRASKVAYVDLPAGDDGMKKNLCVMVTLSPELAKNVFDNIVKKSERNLSAQDEAVLYERFLAKQATEEMDKAFEDYQKQ